MEVRRAVHEFADHARNLLGLLRSPEGKTLSRGDLDILEVQLYLLGKEVTKKKEGNQSSA